MVSQKLEKRREFDNRDVPAPTTIATGPSLSRVSTTAPEIKQSQQTSTSSSTFIPDSQPSPTPLPGSKDNPHVIGKRSSLPRPVIPMDTVSLKKPPSPVVPNRSSSKVSPPPPPPRFYTHPSYRPSTATKSPRPEHLKNLVSTSSSSLPTPLKPVSESHSSPSKTITPPFSMSVGESSGYDDSQDTAATEEEGGEGGGSFSSTQGSVASEFHDDEDIMPPEVSPPVREIESSKSDIYICQTSCLLF